jgi:hypothetical protein
LAALLNDDLAQENSKRPDVPSQWQFLAAILRTRRKFQQPLLLIDSSPQRLLAHREF